MEKIHVKASSHAYLVTIGENIRFELHTFMNLQQYSSVFVITDEYVHELYGESFIKAIHHNNIHTAIIPSGEQSKSFEQYFELQTQALSHGIDRKGLIIAFGGGMVGDIAGFVAATLLRGVDYIQVPTTILAHDSSVGGKVAINHPLGKNLIGNFYAPKAVIYDVDMLNTLPVHEIRSGYAELIKEALIDDPVLFEQMIESSLSIKEMKDFIPLIKRGIQIKARIVEEDEKESGIRAYLNLGHTLGHAIEAHAGYGNITHGEAVAIGLLFSLYVSEHSYSVSLPIDRLYQWFVENHYPMQLDEANVPAYIDFMQKDKKVQQDLIYMVLLENIGQPTSVGFSAHELTTLLTEFIKEMHTW